jgi:hypothetical protein
MDWTAFRGYSRIAVVTTGGLHRPGVDPPFADRCPPRSSAGFAGASRRGEVRKGGEAPSESFDGGGGFVVI